MIVATLQMFPVKKFMTLICLGPCQKLHIKYVDSTSQAIHFYTGFLNPKNIRHPDLI